MIGARMSGLPPSTPENHDPVQVEDLVVSYCFPPYADTAAVVAAKRVAVAGRPVDVIQNAMSNRSADPDLLRLTGGLVRRRAELPTLTMFSSWRSVREFTETGLQQALTWDRDGPGYRRVYSRAHFIASHFLTARLLLLRPGLSWTAEFSDPLSHDVTGAVRHSDVQPDGIIDRLSEGLVAAGARPPESGNAYEWAEVLAMALADRIVFTNEHQRDFMLERLEDSGLAARAAERAEVSHHPVPAPELYHLTDPAYALRADLRHVGYFGNFYETRGMDMVLDALVALPDGVRSRLRLHVFTASPQDLTGPVRDRGLSGTVVSAPFVGYLDFLALTTRFDALLVSDATTAALGRNPFLPSKWSDYRGSGTPVWGVVEEDSVLSRQPLTFRSPVGHVSAAAHVLAQIARLPRRSVTAQDAC